MRTELLGQVSPEGFEVVTLVSASTHTPSSWDNVRRDPGTREMPADLLERVMGILSTELRQSELDQSRPLFRIHAPCLFLDAATTDALGPASLPTVQVSEGVGA